MAGGPSARLWRPKTYAGRPKRRPRSEGAAWKSSRGAMSQGLLALLPSALGDESDRTYAVHPRWLQSVELRRSVHAGLK
jgi:hypothetical protein